MLRHITSSAGDPALLVGLESPDDAAVLRLNDTEAIVQTVDFFTPVVDDARSWGRIAAANALSDVYAMGARPLTAMNLVGWPRELPFELLGEVLEGAGEVCAAAGALVVGGHSVDDPEPKFGLAVTGLVHPDRVVRKTGAPPGSDLVLTKPLGTGIVSSAIKEGLASRETVARAVEVMETLNRDACEAMLEVGAEAATDVTGFGLAGHLLEMLGDGLDAELEAGAIPMLPDAVGLAARGVLSGGSKRNREGAAERVDLGELDEGRAAVVFDAQTSGGLLIAVDASATAGLVERLRCGDAPDAARIGRLIPGQGRIEVTGA